ncbi:hypothetical protein L345_04699, partial [Ophiophagus hannah]
MRQAMLHWNKKLANNKHARAGRNMKSVTVQRKQTTGSQAGARGSNEVNLPQRVKKPSPSKWSKWELMAIVGSIFLLLYIVLCYESFHFHVAHMYAHLGYPNAQHIVGQRYLKAAEKGHPHSSFNLAVGKLKNMTTGLEDRDVEKLLNVAAGHGVQEAQNLLDNIRNRQLP